MERVNMWLIVRDGVPVHVRLTEGEAEACRKIEESAFHHETVDVIPGEFVYEPELVKEE